MSDQTHHTITAPSPPASTQGQGRLLLSSQVAVLLGVSARHVQMQARAGLIPHGETQGGHRRIALADVVASVQRSGIKDFSADDRLVPLSAASRMCGVPVLRFKEAAQRIGVPFARTIGASTDERGHLRVMQRDIPRVRQHLLHPHPSSPPAA